MTQREKQALRYFAAGYNCAQSVAMAYGDLAGLTPEQAALVSAGFGGGIGRMRQNCGAFSAAVMVMGALCKDGGAPAGRPAVYGRVRQVHDAFAAECGTINCGELLRRHPGAEGPQPEERTPAYYASRPCARVILKACRIIEQQIATGE